MKCEYIFISKIIQYVKKAFATWKGNATRLFPGNHHPGLSDRSRELAEENKQAGVSIRKLTY